MPERAPTILYLVDQCSVCYGDGNLVLGRGACSPIVWHQHSFQKKTNLESGRRTYCSSRYVSIIAPFTFTQHCTLQPSSNLSRLLSSQISTIKTVMQTSKTLVSVSCQSASSLTSTQGLLEAPVIS